jgi:type I restriction enzyme M protein
MGKGFQPLILRNPLSGTEVRDSENRPVLDSDFVKVREGFRRFTSEFRWHQTRHNHAALSGWRGARISNIMQHPNIDMKPRRLVPKALENMRTIKASTHLPLALLADVLDNPVDIVEEYGLSKLWRLVEGSNIRAVEGTVVPHYPAHSWEIAERKSKRAYLLQYKDIIVGLVRPERRNIGMLLDSSENMVGIPDGIAVVRVKSEYQEQYPQEWLFATLRSEACRLQFWTESGGTSYGKLTRDHILNVLLPVPDSEQIQMQAEQVQGWAQAIENGIKLWENVGTEEDRMSIVNSAIYGLESTDE